MAEATGGLNFTELTYDNRSNTWNQPLPSDIGQLVALLRNQGLRMVKRFGNNVLTVLFYNNPSGPEFLDVIVTITGEETELRELNDKLGG